MPLSLRSDPINTFDEYCKWDGRTEREAQEATVELGVEPGQSQKSQVHADQGARGMRAPQSHTKTKEREGLAQTYSIIFGLFFLCSLLAPPPLLPRSPGCQPTPKPVTVRVRAKNSKTVNSPTVGAPWARAQ
jgi:hypothetical protein